MWINSFINCHKNDNFSFWVSGTAGPRDFNSNFFKFNLESIYYKSSGIESLIWWYKIVDIFAVKAFVPNNYLSNDE